MANSQPVANYYAILKVDRRASQAAIKQAYRQLARQHHPDLNPGDGEAAERFKLLGEAYSVLSNPVTRRQYDRYGPQWQTLQPHHSANRNPRSEATDDFEDMEFGRFSRFEDLLGDLFERYG